MFLCNNSTSLEEHCPLLQDAFLPVSMVWRHNGTNQSYNRASQGSMGQNIFAHWKIVQEF